MGQNKLQRAHFQIIVFVMQYFLYTIYTNIYINLFWLHQISHAHSCTDSPILLMVKM